MEKKTYDSVLIEARYPSPSLVRSQIKSVKFDLNDYGLENTQAH